MSGVTEAEARERERTRAESVAMSILQLWPHEHAREVNLIHEALLTARADALREAGKVAAERHVHWRLPHRDDANLGEVCDDISACADISSAILSLIDKAEPK